jgi:hypothetical protein
VESIITSLALLACPLGMGAMMWFMMRGMKPAPPARQPDDLAGLRAEHSRLEAEVERLRAAEQVQVGRR